MKHPSALPLLTLLLLPAAISSCGCSSGGSRPGTVSSHVRDHDAYRLGSDHAERVMTLTGDEAALQDALLDVNARATNIEAKLGAQSAADYRRGFTDRIKADNDSLARILF